MEKTLLKKLLCGLVITLMIGTSIPAQAGNVSNPTSNGKNGTSGGGYYLCGYVLFCIRTDYRTVFLAGTDGEVPGN